MSCDTGFQQGVDGYFIYKDPDDRKDYTIDWSKWLEAGDTIASVAWVVDAGINNDAVAHTTTTATIYLSGGTAGVSYNVTCRITTSFGLIADQSFQVRCREA